MTEGTRLLVVEVQLKVVAHVAREARVAGALAGETVHADEELEVAHEAAAPRASLVLVRDDQQRGGRHEGHDAEVDEHVELHVRSVCHAARAPSTRPGTRTDCEARHARNFHMYLVTTAHKLAELHVRCVCAGS